MGAGDSIAVVLADVVAGALTAAAILALAMVLRVAWSLTTRLIGRIRPAKRN